MVVCERRSTADTRQKVSRQAIHARPVSDDRYSGESASPPRYATRRTFELDPIGQKGRCVVLHVSKDDVLRGLKKCKRLAKQDLLISPRTSMPTFWRRHADVRRNEYTLLMRQIEREGVEATIRDCLAQYAALPRYDFGEEPSPIDAEISGREQALETFFVLVGADRRVVLHARNGRPRSMRYSPRTANEFTSDTRESAYS